ncbi:bifunctional metallophosphatase/5'-nucleotidase [Liquorilactobacillus oeni]|uniref:2,3-cyclic-nucleotide 2-phosphodiesterase n=1 Tax=Liquorilactobacillus oeni DSM 19972 TaxID=1423777 RepID=A0A0R1MA96_9LACO|nr:bifunctional UDP-sugar hydrolase/5'-nucleotidase [Liquorilactobacillus oeni]KRL05055.1 hypothetical protein FD46_GL000996 [Liquorilactobacillus oeni DSM 19972]
MKVQILSTSDVHGFIYPTNFSQRNDQRSFGFLKAASLIKKQRAAADVTFYIENGDFIEGSPMAAYAHQKTQGKNYYEIFMRLTNLLKTDAGVLGNHEFNYGEAYLERVLAKRDYPILGANLITKKSSVIDAPYTIIVKGGLKVAILGLTTQYIPHWERSANIVGWQFKSIVEIAKKWVPLLHTKADLVIVAYHGGFECDLVTGKPNEPQTGENEGFKLLAEVPGIDVLITGHQHRKIATKINGVPVTQPGYRGDYVGCITLELDKNHKLTDSKAELLSVANEQVESETTAITHTWYADTQKWLDQPLANIQGNMEIKDHLRARLYGHPYLDFVNHVQMEAMDTEIAATSLFNDEVKGLSKEVTIRNVLNSYVFPNTLVVERVSGRDLKEALERCASFFEIQQDGTIKIAPSFLEPKQQLFNYDYYTGIEYTFDLTQPVGCRVKNLQYRGQRVEMTEHFKVALNQYRGVGGGEYPMFSAAKVLNSSDIEVPQLLIDYLNKHPKISATIPHNIKVITE